MALDYQEKCHERYQKLMPADSPILKQSQMRLDEFMHYSVQ